MTAKTFLSIGECMIELSGGEGDLWRMGYAGDTLNVAWTARALLDPVAWRVAYLTRLGEDAFSDRILAFLRAHAIDDAHISRDPKRSPGLYVIERKEGERSFTYWRDSSAARLLADDEPALARALAAAEMIHVSGITLAILAPDRRLALTAGLAAARRRGAKVAFDPNVRPRLWEDAATMRAAIERAASAASILLPSFEDEAATFGDADPEATAARYLALGAEEVAVKDGPRHVLVATPSGREHVAVEPAARVVDTTGAGDAFDGAYLAARAEGAPPAAAARLASRVARLTVERLGALAPPADLAAAFRAG